MIRLRVWANAQPMGWFGHEAAQYFSSTMNNGLRMRPHFHWRLNLNCDWSPTGGML